ncbi:MAG TPA: glycosyltransferase family 2 protein [Solirubrobacteraceae bacterium]
MDATQHDLSIVVVSTNEAHWLEACLKSVYAQAGSARLDVVVVDNESKDGTRELVERCFPKARVVSCANRGFAHANNRALMTCTARYALCLNPDTEILQGAFGELVEMLDRRPEIGLLGVKQLDGELSLYPTVRRFPSARRALAEAFTAESWPLRPAGLGERELDLRKYESELECDWVTGAFMLIRREALLGAGLLDERLFLFSDEPDLCLRVKRGGWKVVHSPAMTIVHHAGKAGIKPALVAQEVFARRVYAEKHFSRPHRYAYLGAIAARHVLRAALPAGRGGGPERRAASTRALRTLVGREAPPFRQPPLAAIDSSTLAGPSQRR